MHPLVQPFCVKQEHLLGLVESTLADLEDAGCIELGGDAGEGIGEGGSRTAGDEVEAPTPQQQIPFARIQGKIGNCVRRFSTHVSPFGPSAQCGGCMVKHSSFTGGGAENTVV